MKETSSQPNREPVPGQLAQELYLRNAELANKNKILSLVRQLYEISILTLVPLELVQRTTKIIQTELDFELVGILTYDQPHDTLTSLHIEKSKRLADSLDEAAHDIFDTIHIPQASRHGFFGKIIKHVRIEYTENLADIWAGTALLKKLESAKERAHVRTVFAQPLAVQDQRILGVPVIGSNRTYDALAEYEKESIRSFVNVMTTALDKALLYQELQVANKKLNAANAQLKKFDQAKTEFLSITSHQLRTPLTGIKGYLSMVLEGDFGKFTKKQNDVLSQVSAEVDRLARMVQVFLNVSRIESGRLIIARLDFDLVELTRNIIRELTPLAEKKSLKLSYEGPDSYPLSADSDKLKDVIMNLIDNAIKYTQKGWIQVTVTPEKNGIMVAVSDSGVGMDAKGIEKLFEKFSRGQGIAKVSADGSGLGLFIVKKIVEAHGGKVWAESKGKEKGSVFAFRLPAEKSAKPAKKE